MTEGACGAVREGIEIAGQQPRCSRGVHLGVKFAVRADEHEARYEIDGTEYVITWIEGGGKAHVHTRRIDSALDLIYATTGDPCCDPPT